MNCRYCGVDMRLYRLNDSTPHSCSHIGEVDERIVDALFGKSNDDLRTLIERLEKVVEEFERRVYSTGTYRTPG